MCCFRLHFSDFNVFFPQKIKILLQFTFEKNNLLYKKREKNNLSRGKVPAPPLDIKWSVPKMPTHHRAFQNSGSATASFTLKFLCKQLATGL